MTERFDPGALVLLRSALGFDSNDLPLDVVATGDLSEWSWKDRDEFDWVHSVGLPTDRQAELADPVRARRIRPPLADAIDHVKPIIGWLKRELATRHRIKTR